MEAMSPLKQHPARARLHGEIHERPPEPMSAPLALSHVVMICDSEQRDASLVHLSQLLQMSGIEADIRDQTHLRIDIGPLRLRWELHTEFVSWTFYRSIGPDEMDVERPPTGIDAVRGDWFAALPGNCLVAMHLWGLEGATDVVQEIGRRMLREQQWVGSAIEENEGQVFTDFMVRSDGFSRMILAAGRMAPRRLGRCVQRLLEIETYRMVALLGLPVARDATVVLGKAEAELSDLAESIRCAERDEEHQLLDRLTRLAAEVEGEYAATHSRFSATAAYFELVDKRVREAGETRLPGLQTIAEFIERRLSPARSTCDWAARRHGALSHRISRVSSLLRTRVEIEQQLSSQALLAAMNRRQGLQLKLQAAVEGLSVAAITYYFVGLCSYLTKGAHEIGWPYSVEGTTAVCVPVVAFAVWCSMRHMHRVIGKGLKERVESYDTDIRAEVRLGPGAVRAPGALRRG